MGERLDIQELKRLAEAATGGPWFVSGVRFRMNGGEWHEVNHYNEALKKDEHICCVGYDARTGEGRSEALYIAAASPSTILALIEIAEAAKLVVFEMEDDADDYDIRYAIRKLSAALKETTDV
jgi:hypothetical protein